MERNFSNNMMGSNQPMANQPMHGGMHGKMSKQHCPPKTAPAQYDPTNKNVVHQTQDVIIPHYHPSHTHNVHHTNFKHVHYYPHTESVENTCSTHHVTCPARRDPSMLRPCGCGCQSNHSPFDIW